MKHLRSIFILALVLAAAGVLRAGDNANFTFVGFSADGKYLAFEQYGEWDGAGGEYATTYFINVDKNVFAAAPVDYAWGSDGEDPKFRLPRLTRYKRLVAANIARFRIVRGNLGKLVAAHPIGDHSFDKATPTPDSRFIEKDGSVVSKTVPFFTGQVLSPEYNPGKIVFTTIEYPVNYLDENYFELELNYTPEKLRCSQYPGDPDSSTEGLILTLKRDINHADNPVQVLQKDTVIPAIRRCPETYSIEQVWAYKGKIAVFLHYNTRGFEGDDLRYMVVTAAIAADAD